MASRDKYFKDEATGESKESKSGGVAEKNPARYFRTYRHETKVENALYRTSQSVIGARPPTIATRVTETHKFPQPFSKSLGSLSYRNQVCIWRVKWGCGAEGLQKPCTFRIALIKICFVLFEGPERCAHRFYSPSPSIFLESQHD